MLTTTLFRQFIGLPLCCALLVPSAVVGDGDRVVVIDRAEESPIDALVAEPDLYAHPERGFGVTLPRSLGARKLIFVIDHRALNRISDKPAASFLGFDRGVKISLGLRYGIGDFLDAGIIRSSDPVDPFDTYELDARMQLLKEHRHVIDCAISGGADWFYQESRDDASGYFGRVMIGRSFLRRVYAGAGFLVHSNSTWSGKRVDHDDHSMGIPVLVNGRFFDWLSVLYEGCFPVAGYRAGVASWAAGLKLSTFRHTFALLVSNSKYVTADGLVSGSDRAGRPAAAFSITRIFDFNTR